MVKLFPFLPMPGLIQSKAKRRAYMVLITPLLLVEYFGHAVRSFLQDFKGCWNL